MTLQMPFQLSLEFFSIIPSDQVSKWGLFLTEEILTSHVSICLSSWDSTRVRLCFSILTCLVISLLEVLISQSWWWHHDYFPRFQTYKNLFIVRVLSRGILFSVLSLSKYYELSLSKRRELGQHKKGRVISHMELWTWWCHSLALHASFPLSIPRYLWIYIYI